MSDLNTRPTGWFRRLLGYLMLGHEPSTSPTAVTSTSTVLEPPTPYTSDIDSKLLSDVDRANQQTSLHMAAAMNHLRYAQELLHRGVDVNAQNKWGSTALHLAVGNDNYEMAELLVQSGAKVGIANNKGETPLGNAVQLGRSRFMTLLGHSIANEPVT